MEKVLVKILDQHRKEKGGLIALLQRIQDTFGYIAEEHVTWFSRQLDIPESRFFGVITFYPKFRMRPVGKNTLTVCCGAACHIKGADKLLAAAESKLGVAQGQTTPDGKVSLMTARCVGACSRAPVVLCDGQVSGETSREQLAAQLERWAVE